MSIARYAQVRIREPLGERVCGEKISIGGADADVLVPGAGSGPAFIIEHGEGVWVVEPVEPGARASGPPTGGRVRLNGRPLISACDLRRRDTLTLGDAQIVITDLSRTLLRVDVLHLAGNVTIAPAATLATLVLNDGGDEDLEIRSLETLRVSPLTKPKRDEVGKSLAALRPRSWKGWLAVGAMIATLLMVAIIASLLEPVSLDIRPADAHVSTPGTLLAIPNASSVLLLPGAHVVRAERAGYVTTQADIVVRGGDENRVGLRLEKLPGQLRVDTNGISATVSVDGVEVGHAPGVLSIPAGSHTVMISAPRYLDYITNVTVEGAGRKQDLKAGLQPSWGSLKVLSIPGGARVSVDGTAVGVTPITIPAPSGVRRIQIAAAGHKTWESNVVLTAGETHSVGPVTLGQPDAHLIVRSDPEGADASVAGTHLGRTPAEIDLPAGIAHQVVLSAPGYKNWSRAVFAEPGRKIALLAHLEPVLARVSLQGEPADAELVVDGAVRGKGPQSLELPATEHRIEIRKPGFAPFKTVVIPEAGLDRTVQYHLIPNKPH